MTVRAVISSSVPSMLTAAFSILINLAVVTEIPKIYIGVSLSIYRCRYNGPRLFEIDGAEDFVEKGR